MKDFTDYIYKGMTDLFELKSIVGLDDSKNSVLVTLVDGRCALVDLKKRVFVVEILLDSFYKWMEFPNSPSQDNLESVKKILEHPEGVGYGPLAEKYVVDPKVERDFDQIKKEAGVNRAIFVKPEEFIEISDEDLSYFGEGIFYCLPRNQYIMDHKDEIRKNINFLPKCLK